MAQKAQQEACALPCSSHEVALAFPSPGSLGPHGEPGLHPTVCSVHLYQHRMNMAHGSGTCARFLDQALHLSRAACQMQGTWLQDVVKSLVSYPGCHNVNEKRQWAAEQ